MDQNDYENFLQDEQETCLEYTEPTGDVDQQTSAPEQIALNCEGTFEQTKTKKGLWIGIILAGIAVLGVLIAVLWNPVCKLLGLGKPYDTPQEHFAYVETLQMNGLADSISAGYGDFLAGYETESLANEAQLHLMLNRDILALITAYSGADISWLDDTALRMETASNGERTGVQLILSLHGTDILTIDVIIDSVEQKLYIGIPELNNTYVAVDMAQIPEDTESAMNEEMIQGIMEQMPAEQDLNRLLRRYLKIVVSNIENVTEKTQTITVEGISQKLTVLEAKIDIHTMGDIVIAVLNEAKNDQQLFGYVQNVMQNTSMNGLEWSAVIDAAIVRVQEQINASEDQSYIIWTDYVDSKDAVVGRVFKTSEINDVVGYLTVTSGDEFAYEFDFTKDFRLTGKGLQTNNKINGNFSVLISGMSFAQVELIDFDAKKLDRGDLCGTVRLTVSDLIKAMLLGGAADIDMSLDFVLDTSDSKSNVDIQFVLEDQIMATIALGWQEKTPYAVRLPESSVAVADEETLAAWTEDMNFRKVLDNLEKAGVPAEYLDYLTALLSTTE